MYAAEKQTSPRVTALVEADAYPAEPEDGYGGKSSSASGCVATSTRTSGCAGGFPRFHNVYAPHGTYDGGREKAPAAICRKVIAAKLSGNHKISIWGDGEQTRSFTFITDAIEGILRIMESDFSDPFNLGSSELVTINELVDIVENIAGTGLEREYDLPAPQGVRRRSSDNTLINQVLGWEPSVPLEEGMARTYDWIYEQMSSSAATRVLERLI